MPLKYGEARSWGQVKTSPDGLRWSAWPKGDNPLVTSQFALQFPSNVNDAGTPDAFNTTAPLAVLRFSNPAAAGLDVYGSGNTAGITIIWAVSYIAQIGYYALHWYSRGDGQFNSPTLRPYHGAHPYPAKGYDDRTYAQHIWECACMGPSGGMDIIDGSGTNWVSGMNTAAPPITSGTEVTYGATFLQALRVTRNSADSVTHTFYRNLPSTTDIISQTFNSTGIGNETIAGALSPQVTVGDSPWFAVFQHERASCIYDRVKWFNADIGQAAVLTESADFTQTSSPNIWWGRNGFDANHVDDGASILCHYGTGRSFTVLNPSANVNHQIQLAGRL